MTIKFINLRIKEIIFLLIMISIIFYNIGTKYVSELFTYIDDMFVIIFTILAVFLCCLRKYGEKKLNVYDRYIIILGIIFVIIGLLGNILSKYQNNGKMILVDILSCMKWFGVYIDGMIIFKKENSSRFFDIAEEFVKIIIVTIIAISVLNIIYGLNLENGDSRFGIPILVTIGNHPSLIGAIGCACISILLVNINKNKKWIIFAMVMTILSLRMKAISYVAIMILIILFNRNKKTFSIKNLIIFALIAIAIAYNTIVGYFFTETGSRGILLNSSFKLVKKFFPIGSGFATFGSVASTRSYSKAYKILNLDQRYGFKEGASSFVGDGGWATQLGQFGFLGTIIFICMIYMVYCSVKKNVNKNINYAPYMSVFLYLLISSTNEISFSANYAVLLALVLVIIARKGQSINETGTKEK